MKVRNVVEEGQGVHIHRSDEDNFSSASYSIVKMLCWADYSIVKVLCRDRHARDEKTDIGGLAGIHRPERIVWAEKRGAANIRSTDIWLARRIRRKISGIMKVKSRSTR